MKKLLTMAAALGSAIPATAAELKGPVPAAPMQEWVAAGDPVQMPKDETVVRPLNFALTISPEGSVIRCTVEGSSGSLSLDDQTCQIFSKRGRFSPAMDSAGKPVIGVYRIVALWGAPGQTASAIPLVEMGIALQTMPQGLSEPAYVDIAVSVDTAGRVDGCATAVSFSWAGQPIAERQAAGQVLSATACAQAVGALKLEAARNAEGQTVRSVQMATALFTAQPNPNDIVVKGTRETKIRPAKGFGRIVDYQPIGSELVLVQSSTGEWYRMALEPPCIGNSRLTRFSRNGAEVQVDSALIERLPRELRDALFFMPAPDGRPGELIQEGLIRQLPPSMSVQETLAFTTTHADGSISRGDEVVAMTIDSQDLVHIDSCQVTSLMASDPPKGIKATPKKK